MKPKFEVVLL